MQNLLKKTASDSEKTLADNSSTANSKQDFVHHDLIGTKYVQAQSGSARARREVARAHIHTHAHTQPHTTRTHTTQNYTPLSQRIAPPAEPSRAHKLLQKYLLRLPLLFLAVAAYAGCIFILQTVQPATIQHIILPNSYFPLLLAAAIGHFFLFSFLFLQVGRGFRASLFFTTLLFLFLHHVLTQQVLLVVITPFLIVEVLLTILAERA